MKSTLLTLDNSRAQHIAACQAPASLSLHPARQDHGWSCSCWAQPQAQAVPSFQIYLPDLFWAGFVEVFLIILGRGAVGAHTELQNSLGTL